MSSPQAIPVPIALDEHEIEKIKQLALFDASAKYIADMLAPDRIDRLEEINSNKLTHQGRSRYREALVPLVDTTITQFRSTPDPLFFLSPQQFISTLVPDAPDDDLLNHHIRRSFLNNMADSADGDSKKNLKRYHGDDTALNKWRLYDQEYVQLRAAGIVNPQPPAHKPDMLRAWNREQELENLMLGDKRGYALSILQVWWGIPANNNQPLAAAASSLAPAAVSSASAPPPDSGNGSG
ncbi:hypothetical protein PMZ80_000961 [Knufia obscura]|uniref:Uncharacterized protein n=2 Tax=Knufia TaxID=430999 RepID=A0AAN8EBN7_9EURO|nr:hypothetical protein PMZ80_000961 [Knufia obscura]KAK5950245.1 hypothetical protein OHC33_008713 [Knufia fluminis]